MSNPNPPDKPGQRVFQGDNALEKARQKMQELQAKDFEVEITVVLSAYKE